MPTYKIKEVNGYFIPGTMGEKKKYFWSKPKEEFVPLRRASFFPEPLRFPTLEEAKGYINMINKPEVYHEV